MILNIFVPQWSCLKWSEIFFLISDFIPKIDVIYNLIQSCPNINELQNVSLWWLYIITHSNNFINTALVTASQFGDQLTETYWLTVSVSAAFESHSKIVLRKIHQYNEIDNDDKYNINDIKNVYIIWFMEWLFL